MYIKLQLYTATYCVSALTSELLSDAEPRVLHVAKYLILY